jgi:hypothetical protein
VSWYNIAQWGWMSHPALVLLESTVIAAALALFDRRTARERLYYGIYTFLSFAGVTLAGGWLMHCIHG